MTLSSVKQDLFLCFADVHGDPDPHLVHVRRVMRGEPRAGDLPAPISMSVITTGMGATEYRYRVSIYARPDVDALVTQDRLDEMIDATEGLFASEFNRGDWIVSYDPGIDALVASCAVVAVRVDD